MARPRKKWELTAVSLNRLLACFHADQETAGQKLKLLHQKLTTFFESNRCHLAEEYADRTIYRVAKKLDEGLDIYTEDPSRFFFGVAYNVLKEYWSDMKRDTDFHHNMQQIDHLSEGWTHESEKVSTEQRKECLDNCLQKLSDEERELITEYYQSEGGNKVKNRKKVADQRGISLNVLRLRIFRIRKKLEDCTRKCLDKS